MSRTTCKDRSHLSRHRIHSLALGFLVSSLSMLASAFADDTEIFFGQVDPDTNVHPNVLFVLDTSGSMNGFDQGYSGTRLERMKSALHTILDSSSNVNVGLMRFNGYYGGGSVVYPITGIDQPTCADNNCGAVSLSYQISQNTDDMEQFLYDGRMTPGGHYLSMGRASNASQLVGYRFQALDIPSGATITSAALEFTAVSSDSGASELTIYGHDVGDAPTIGTRNKYLEDLPRTSNASRVTWEPEPWTTERIYQTPDISDIVQEVVDRADWCGSQAMGFIVEGTGERAAYSYNNSPSRAAILRLTYDSTSIPATKGCVTKSAIAQINNSSDDAFERTQNGRIVTGANKLRIPQLYNNPAKEVVTRLRFKNLSVPAGAVIDSASIEFEVDVKSHGALSLTFEGEAADSAPSLVADHFWISNRPVLSDPIVWNISSAENWDENTKVATPDLSDHVQKIVNRTGWQMNNNLAFIIRKNGNSDNRRIFDTFDGELPAAAKLRITYRANVGTPGNTQIVYNTARDDMKKVVSELSATGGTPIVASYYEAVQYMLGGDVHYGTQRGYYRHRFHRVSHPDSYTGGSVSKSSSCHDSNPESADCTYEQIIGTAVYKSPLADSCQTNHIVFLSDGVPTSNTAVSRVKNLIGGSPSCDPAYGNEACGRELATWLDTTDHNQNVARSQNISTYTIGFNIQSNFLSDLATSGGGTYYDAASSDELVKVFQNILGDVLAVDTSFVAPGATVNQFNRLTHRNDIYFAVFKPNERPVWDGNLKRYHVGADANGDITIQDKNGQLAVDRESGFFSNQAQSWWSDSVDGNSVEKGGAASNISLSGAGGSANRRVFTFTGNTIPATGVDLTAYAQRLHESNASITEAKIGLSSGTAADRADRRTDLLKWARGIDVRDDDLDGETNDVRLHIGDPMHAQPVIINYGNGANPHTTIFVATNEGLLHAIEQENGTELYAFMPQELLSNLNPFFENQQSTKHPYGLDGDLSVWHEDINENVTVDAGEKAYLYVGMRRGGNQIYAFDVSDRLNPRLAWQIKGGTGDFEQLGQTWSKAVPTSIMVNNTIKKVLIFGGGYDTNQDPNTANLVATQTPDSLGNAIYIVDAETGARIWVGQGVSGGDEQFSDMDYSIPSDIRVIDIDANGLADQLYVGDMGGQLWRFDLQPFHQSGDLVQGGVIANLNGSGMTNARRFYNEPDVALIAKNGERFLSISIGSGWRAHPLNETVEDRFYMVRSHSPYKKPAGYGKNAGSATSPIWLPLTEDDLIDVTDDIDPAYNANGWMLKLESSGEKVMGASITVNNQLIFTTYEPVATGDACSPAVGGGAVYALDVKNGAPVLNLDDSGDDGDSENSESGEADDDNENVARYGNQELSKEDRRKTLKQDGIPPSPTALITETNGKIGTTILVSTEQPVDVDFSNLTQRTYWQDNGRGNESPSQITASGPEN